MPNSLRTRPLRAAVPFALVAAIELGARLLAIDVVGLYTKPLLMPTLALVPALCAPARPASLRRLLFAGLGLSWAGDVILMWEGVGAFAAGLGAFLLAHVAYVALFAKGLEGRISLGALAYAGTYVAMIASLAPHVGPLLVPVIVYGAVLSLMAALATRGGAALAAGGALFVVSDGLLAAARFLPNADIPRPGFFVMLTYLAAQALITLGMTARLSAARD